MTSAERFDTSVLRLPLGPVRLAEHDTRDTAGYAGDKEDAETSLAEIGVELADLQERLWALRTAGDERRVLLVLQGMDTSGKGGVIRKALGLVDPQGLQITAFKAPTEEERQQDFLWRIRKALPAPGYIGVFDRSHYEDVLAQRVRGLADPAEIERRYDAIVDFERELVHEGVTVVKCFLHMSAEEQGARLLKRLDNPEKHWKYAPSDVDDRALWSAYQEAYEVAFERTNHPAAPWHLIPADRKWLRNLAVAALLRDTLALMGLEWPRADFDVEAERQRLEAVEVR